MRFDVVEATHMRNELDLSSKHDDGAIQLLCVHGRHKALYMAHPDCLSSMCLELCPKLIPFFVVLP